MDGPSDSQLPLQPSLLQFSSPWLAALPLPSFIQHLSLSGCTLPPWPQPFSIWDKEQST